LRDSQLSLTVKCRCFNALRLASEMLLQCAGNGKHRMLKIHRSGNGEVVLTLSGRMDHESTLELENVIEAEEMKGRQIVLDIKDLTLVGQSDIDFLIRCEAAGIKLVNCARYVREWIARQQGGK
jgi:hypothetical protein